MAKVWAANLNSAALNDIIHQSDRPAGEKARAALEIEKFFNSISERKSELTKKKERS